MNEPHLLEFDERLRRAFEAEVADGGFTARVMQALPPRPRRRAWPLTAAALAGSVLAWLSLAPSTLVELAAVEWLAADPGPHAAVLLALLGGMGVLGCAWALEEGP
jgi:hypothetical protein